MRFHPETKVITPIDHFVISCHHCGSFVLARFKKGAPFNQNPLAKKHKWSSILKPIGNRSSRLDLDTMVLLFKLSMWDFSLMCDIHNSLLLTHESLPNHINTLASPKRKSLHQGVKPPFRYHTHILLHRIRILLYTEPSCHLLYCLSLIHIWRCRRRG